MRKEGEGTIKKKCVGCECVMKKGEWGGGALDTSRWQKLEGGGGPWGRAATHTIVRLCAVDCHHPSCLNSSCIIVP
jgi:hypothetical protein